MIRFLIVLLVVTTIGCTTSEKSSKKTISVSILPQKYFTEAIAGEKFRINVMVPPGASPESYEPTAMQMKNLSESIIYFRIGYIPFETGWMKNLSAINPEMKIYDLSEGIELISDDHHGEQGVDPHIWSSVQNATIIAKNIYNALILEDPENKEFYSANLNKFISFADSLDLSLKKQFSDLKGAHFLIYHPALAYLAKDYGMHQVAIESEGKIPDPGYLKDIINISREKKIKFILVQKQFNTEPAETIAREIDADIMIIDPLDENWGKQMEHIGASIVKAAGTGK